MITVEAFKSYHVDLLRAQGIQGAQLREVSHVPEGYASLIRGLTAFDGAEVLMCGGVSPLLPGVGELWALLSERAGRHMLWINRATERYLTMQSLRRLQATVEKTFLPGCRWLEIMNFEYEGEMKGYGPEGETHLRYARLS